MASVIKHWAGCRHLEKLGGSHEEQVACLKLEAKVCNLLCFFFQRVKHLGLFDGGAWHRRRPRWETEYTRSKSQPKVTLARNLNTLFISCMLLAVWWNTRGNWTNKENTMETARLGKEWFEKRKSPSMMVLHMVPGFGSSLYPILRYSNGSYFIGNFVHGMREGPGSLQVLLILMMIGFLYWYWLHHKIIQSVLGNSCWGGPCDRRNLLPG